MSPILIAALALVLAHTGAMAGEMMLGCLSAVPENATVVSSTSALSDCGASCASSSYNHSFFDSKVGSCSCSASSAVNTLYTDAVDTEANCPDGAVWYSALTNSTSHTTTTCPVIGPTSSASLPGYTYLSTYPDPLSCYAACQAAEQGVTLLQPGLSGYSCACADSIEGEGYTEVCNSQSWYVVVEAQKGAEDGSRRRRALRTANMASPAR